MFNAGALLLFRGRHVVHKDADISFLHHVRLSFLPVLATFLHLGHTGLSIMQGLEIIKVGHLGLDETPLKVCVDNTGCLWSQASLLDRPSPDLLRTARVEGLQAQGSTARTDQTGNHGLDFRLGTGQTTFLGFVRTLFQEGYVRTQQQGNSIDTIVCSCSFIHSFVCV